MIYATLEKQREISFPIGGIGTGCFGIAGNGRFVDWEIFNKPNKGDVLGFSHIAVRAKLPDGKVIVKILNGDTISNLTGFPGRDFDYGAGISSNTMSGMPHFSKCVFDGGFPIAKLSFSDENFPADVELTIFNPFIPLDSFNSSIPAGFFDIKFINKLDLDIEYSAAMSICNPFDHSLNEKVCQKGKNYLRLTTVTPKDDIEYGEICVATTASNIEIQPNWFRGNWCDNIDVFIQEMLSNKKLEERTYPINGAPRMDTGTLLSRMFIPAKSTDNVRFVLTWHVPHTQNYWNEKADKRCWKNYYATVFSDSVASAEYCLDNFDNLYQRTVAFKETLFNSNLDSTIIEAISATLSVLKSPTVLRLEDGSFYGWEGVWKSTGSCEGTCQHVWNYAYALCFLFPDLERSIRNNELKYTMSEDGKMAIRLPLPLGSERITGPCFDGQMGFIIKTYRDWKISGNTEWLKEIWSGVKKALEFTWYEKECECWDTNKDGVLEGKMHHTLDVEQFGPSGWLQGFYLCALRAAEEMANFLGDYEFATECTTIFEKGYAWTKEHLFNGEYFIHKIDIKDKKVVEDFNLLGGYWDEESGEIKYQTVNGCEIDQLCGQWHANICGLGRLFDDEQIKSSLKSLYKYNYKPSMREVFNTWRVFSLNDESGVIICSYPYDRPRFPIPYYMETMTGFEYALAGLMISEGMEKEGLEIVHSIRDRYDGAKRNPWNEIECGSNYARAMAAFALLPIYSGFSFDLPNNMIGFNPIHKENFKSLFSVGTAWGEMKWTNSEITISIKEGYLNLDKIAIKANVQQLFIDGKEVDFTYDNETIHFGKNKATKDIIIVV